MPVLYDERQNERNQQKIEEIKHVADRCCGEYLPLIYRQLLLPLQIFKHDRLLPRLVTQRLIRWKILPDTRRFRLPPNPTVRILGVNGNTLRPRAIAWTAAATGFPTCGA